MTTRAAAGWYADHQDHTAMRYWDGRQWTELVLPAAVLDAPRSRRASRRPTWWRRHRVLTAAFAVLALLIGAAALAPGEQAPADNVTSPQVPEASTTSPPPTAATTVEPVVDPVPTSPPAPVITYRTVRTEQRIPFARRVLTSATLAKGVLSLRDAGRPGLRVLVYRQTLRDGRPIGRELVRSRVARAPVAQVRVRGTFVPPEPEPAPTSSCDSNYAGACVPIASDVDCGGGSGNGPGYVYSEVKVVGSDIYDLDADGDGYGC